MSKIHVLTGNLGGSYKVVLHTPIPPGNNSAGKSWSDVVIGAGLNVTSLVVGTKPGQITTAEKTNVENGTVFEISETLFVESEGTTPAELQTAVGLEADKIITKKKVDFQLLYKYFGHTQG